MKKIITLVFSAMLIMLMLSGCASSALEYDMNLGYDFNSLKHNDITFNVYHSNTEDGSWEKITSFPCTPKPGHYNDVKLECKKGKITVVLEDNTFTVSEDGKSASYDGTVEASYEFEVDGFKGSLPGWKYFEVKDMEGEQMLRLYPITNDEGVTFIEDIGLDKVYDPEHETNAIDHLLITVVMK